MRPRRAVSQTMYASALIPSAAWGGPPAPCQSASAPQAPPPRGRYSSRQYVRSPWPYPALWGNRVMTETHEAPLVALSILLAICASYTALTLAGRVTAARGRARLAWLSGGSVAMGTGIWSMHFVAMLAFRLSVPISYDVVVVAGSFLAAVGASAFALFMASRGDVRLPRLLSAGLVLGLAIFTMHYTGMAAVRGPGVRLTYDLVLVGNSLVIAVTAATIALWLFLWLRNDDTRRGRALRGAAAIVMGLAISGVHYTAMAAAHFNVDP